MSNELQPYRESPLGEPLAMSGVGSDVPRAQGMMWLASGFRRRWKMVVLITLVLAAPSVTAVWKYVATTYTAKASIEVKPILSAIMHEDESTTRALPLFDSFLNTQAQKMLNFNVLQNALTDQRVMDVPLFRSPTAVADLREVLTVQTLPRTHLVEISVTQHEPLAAVKLTKAVLDAYLATVVGAGEAGDEKRLADLVERRKRLQGALKLKSKEIETLAGKYGASSEFQFNTKVQLHGDSVIETKKELERTKLELLQYDQQVEQLEDQDYTGPIGEENLAAERDRLINNDPDVLARRGQLRAATEKLSIISSKLQDSHLRVVAARQEVVDRRRDLDKVLEEAAAEAVEQLSRSRAQRVVAETTRLASLVKAFIRKRDVLQKNVNLQEEEGRAIGMTGLEIQQIKDAQRFDQEQYDEVSHHLERLRVEALRVGRIVKAADAEVRPDGIKDDRPKLSVAAVLGSLFFALGVAFLRDRLDVQLHDPRQVESGMGLRLLGAVPSLRELQDGLISKEDFVESYRVIRATLAAMGPEGSPPKSLLVTSAQAGEGKTSLAVSLALSLAEPGSRVLLVDGDVQGPQVARLLKLKPPHDLRDALSGKHPVSECATNSGVPGLDVLVARINGHSSRGVLNSRSAARVIAEAATLYDHVVIDSPPALGAADALSWAHVADGVIVASLVGGSNRTAMKLACQRLCSVNANLLGAVTANVSSSEAYYSYSATSYREPGDETPVPAGEPRREPPVVHLPEPKMHAGSGSSS